MKCQMKLKLIQILPLMLALTYAHPLDRSTRNVDHSSFIETPHNCLHIPIDLRPCNDDEIADEIRRKIEAFVSGAKSEKVTVIYKLLGCLPSSVPFKLPICKEEDTLRRDLEVRTLYSYKSRYPSFAKSISGTTSTTIRPAEDSVSSKSKNEEKLTEEVKAEENPQDESLDISTPKRKSVINNAGIAKAYTSGGTVESNPVSGEEQSTNENGRVLKKIPETENFNSIMDIESIITEKLADVYYHVGKNDIQADERVKETIEAKEQKPFKVYVVEMEFPYTKAIPYDPEKLEIAKIGSEFPYSKAIPFDSKKLQVAGHGTEFPYTKAIPFNAEKLYVPKRGIEFPYDKAISYDERNLKVAKQGSEFPYHMAIPYDSRNLHVPGRGLEFPNAEAIPYDPSILKMAKSEYNFVYHKATPYDSEKMYVYTRQRN